ncbi:MAG: hypothetical protein HC915_18160 [Anaerolineae bacterium]|nr:hypothetical protein [Anaerolineae bacterium]
MVVVYEFGNMEHDTLAHWSEDIQSVLSAWQEAEPFRALLDFTPIRMVDINPVLEGFVVETSSLRPFLMGRMAVVLAEGPYTEQAVKRFLTLLARDVGMREREIFTDRAGALVWLDGAHL